jgi:GntR family transcriptional regulator, galactonate operon transcriptional repressor
MKVRINTLPNQVAGILARRIAMQELKDGLVPSELEISLEFSVSRAVAREALKILAALDMVEIAQGRRVVARPESEWDYLSPALIDWLPHEQIRQLFHELHDARLIFEPAIAAVAAQTLTPHNLSRLGELVDEMQTSHDDTDRYLGLDLEFHMEICRATHNRILDRFMYSSRWWQSASRRISNQAPGALTIATKQHQAIYDALVERDPAKAEAAMRSHLLENTILKIIDGQAE